MHLIIPTRWLSLYKTKQTQLVSAKTQEKTNAAFFPWLTSPQVRILTQYGKTGFSAFHSHSSIFCVLISRYRLISNVRRDLYTVVKKRGKMKIAFKLLQSAHLEYREINYFLI